MSSVALNKYRGESRMVGENMMTSWISLRNILTEYRIVYPKLLGVEPIMISSTDTRGASYAVLVVLNMYLK